MPLFIWPFIRKHSSKLAFLVTRVPCHWPKQWRRLYCAISNDELVLVMKAQQAYLLLRRMLTRRLALFLQSKELHIGCSSLCHQRTQRLQWKRLIAWHEKHKLCPPLSPPLPPQYVRYTTFKKFLWVLLQKYILAAMEAVNYTYVVTSKIWWERARTCERTVLRRYSLWWGAKVWASCVTRKYLFWNCFSRQIHP